MNTAQLLSYSIISLVFTTLLLGFVLAVVVISYRRILERLAQLQHKELEMREKWQSEEQQILSEAHERANKLISDTNKVKEEQAALQKNLYEQTLGSIKMQTVELVEQIASQIKSVVTADFNESKDELRKSISEQYQKDYQQIKKDLELYKQTAVAAIDERVKMVIKDVSLKIFGKALSQQDHAELITKALEEAKKRHVI